MVASSSSLNLNFPEDRQDLYGPVVTAQSVLMK